MMRLEHDYAIPNPWPMQGFTRASHLLRWLEDADRPNTEAACRLRAICRRGITYSHEDFDVMSLACRELRAAGVSPYAEA